MLNMVLTPLDYLMTSTIDANGPAPETSALGEFIETLGEYKDTIRRTLFGLSRFEQYVEGLKEHNEEFGYQVDELSIRAIPGNPIDDSTARAPPSSPKYFIEIDVPGLTTHSDWERHSEPLTKKWGSWEDLDEFEERTQRRVEEMKELLTEEGFKVDSTVLEPDNLRGYR